MEKQKENDFNVLMMNLGSAFFYGDFKAETPNEKAIQATLEKYGYFFGSEDEVIARRQLVNKQGGNLTQRARDAKPASRKIKKSKKVLRP